MVIIKRDFKKSTTTTREINSMLILLSYVVPLISESVKSQASKCAIPNQIQIISDQDCNPNLILQEWVVLKELSSYWKNYLVFHLCLYRECNQKEKNTPTAIVSSNKSNPLPPSDCPVPNNDNFSWLKKLFKLINTTHKKTKLLTYWSARYRG